MKVGYLASAVTLASLAATLSGCGGGSTDGGGGGGGGGGGDPSAEPIAPTANPVEPSADPVAPTTTQEPAAPTTTTTTTTTEAGCVQVVMPHTGTLSEQARIVDELNADFLAFDESDATSVNGVTLRMTDDFSMWCGTGCDNGQADCRVSASVYNHKVMLKHDSNNIAVTMSRDAGIIFNQTAVETEFGKCSYMYDGATFHRVNRGCGCGSETPYCGNHGSPFDSEDCIWDTPRAWNTPVGCTGEDTGTGCGSCHPNTATSPDVAECACNAPNPRFPLPQRTTDQQCFWQGVAINGTEGTYPSQLREMLLQRIENQVGTEEVGEPTVRHKQEYWNEIILDAEVLTNSLHSNPRAAVAAFVYIRGHGAGRDKANRMSQKAVEDYGGPAIPVIELDPAVDGVCNGPFRVPDEAVESISV